MGRTKWGRQSKPHMRTEMAIGSFESSTTPPTSQRGNQKEESAGKQPRLLQAESSWAGPPHRNSAQEASENSNEGDCTIPDAAAPPHEKKATGAYRHRRGPECAKPGSSGFPQLNKAPPTCAQLGRLHLRIASLMPSGSVKEIAISSAYLHTTPHRNQCAKTNF